jgi:SsrA-binding protein
VAENRKARHDYIIEDKYRSRDRAGRHRGQIPADGQGQPQGFYARIKNGEVFVYQMHIGAYPFAYYDNHDPLRPRKLLLHNYEIKKLYGKVNEKGYSLIPLKLYFKAGKVKLSLALAKGKQSHDKRETIRRRDQKRELDRERKNNR